MNLFADFVNQKLHKAKVLLDQWQQQAQQAKTQTSQWVNFMWVAQQAALSEAVHYFLQQAIKGFSYELLEACDARSDFVQALKVKSGIECIEPEDFLVVLASFRKASPELSQWIYWLQTDESVQRLLNQYQQYAFIKTMEQPKVEQKIILQEAVLTDEDLLDIHETLMNYAEQWREQMQAF